MKQIYDFLNKRKFRILSVVILMVTFSHEINGLALLPAIFVTCIFLLEGALLLMDESWWNAKKYIVTWALIMMLFLVIRFYVGLNFPQILWPLVWILGIMDSQYNWLSLILASITSMLIVIVSVSDDLKIETIVALIGLYMGVRSLRIRKEANRTKQLHLDELNQSLAELKEAHEALQEASVHSMRYAALEERTRIAREIHDGIGHQLTSLIIQLQALELMIQKEPEKAEDSVTQLLTIARKAMAEVRLAVKEWSNDEMGLGIVALRGLISQTQAQSAIQFKFYEDSELSEWPMEISVVLYRILQESLTNILRHSNAKLVEIHIEEVDESIRLSVVDDGIVDKEIVKHPGFGITGMMERAKALGGTCTINREEISGFSVEVRLPLGSTISKHVSEMES